MFLSSCFKYLVTVFLSFLVFYCSFSFLSFSHFSILHFCVFICFIFYPLSLRWCILLHFILSPLPLLYHFAFFHLLHFTKCYTRQLSMYAPLHACSFLPLSLTVSQSLPSFNLPPFHLSFHLVRISEPFVLHRVPRSPLPPPHPSFPSCSLILLLLLILAPPCLPLRAPPSAIIPLAASFSIKGERSLAI